MQRIRIEAIENYVAPGALASMQSILSLCPDMPALNNSLSNKWIQKQCGLLDRSCRRCHSSEKLAFISVKSAAIAAGLACCSAAKPWQGLVQEERDGPPASFYSQPISDFLGECTCALGPRKQVYVARRCALGGRGEVGKRGGVRGGCGWGLLLLKERGLLMTHWKTSLMHLQLLLGQEACRLCLDV